MIFLGCRRVIWQVRAPMPTRCYALVQLLRKINRKINPAEVTAEVTTLRQ